MKEIEQIRNYLFLSKYDENTLIKTGVYFIKNNITNKVYIGSACATKGSNSKKGFRSRFFQHVLKLYQNKHRNIHLQHSWNKYGYKAFSFEIYKSLPVKEALEEEFFLLKNYKGDLYNICKNSLARVGKTCSLEIKEKLSKLYTNKPRPLSVRVKLAKPIIQLTLEGKFIKEYYGIAEAHRQTDIQRQDIGKVCMGKLKQAGGFKWKYK